MAEALRIEFIWPNWIKYQDDLRKEGITLRGTANPLRNKIGIYNEQGNVRNSAYVEHLFMYSKSKLLPEPEESEGFRLDRRVRMFEGALPSLGSILLLAKLLPANILNAYLANTWESNQLDQFPNSEISAQYLFELNNCRLVVKPSEVSIDRLAYATRRPVICPDTYAYRAPDPWNWQEFQDFRCLYTEMLAMLVDWLSGWDGGSGARMYLSRRG